MLQSEYRGTSENEDKDVHLERQERKDTLIMENLHLQRRMRNE